MRANWWRWHQRRLILQRWSRSPERNRSLRPLFRFSELNLGVESCIDPQQRAQRGAFLLDEIPTRARVNGADLILGGLVRLRPARLQIRGLRTWTWLPLT